MATNILGIGQSALAAAQVGLSTTGHNIANAATPGFNRQVVVQGAAKAQDFGFGFLGQGTEVSTVKRIYSEFLGSQVRSAQTSKSGLDSYYTQIKQIDNMLADPDSGLSPALQNFFSGIQELSTDPSSMPARQAALSSAESLASRMQSMAGRLDEIGQGVNSQITSSVNAINSYARQIAQLNDTIGRVQNSTGQPPNDLFDQRDQLILDLNKEIKATVVKQGNGDYNIFIGNGQPLVVGTTSSTLTTVASPINPEKIEVAYLNSNGSVASVGESSFTGGNLGGLLEFRSQSLEPAQASLNNLAIGLATTFNDQHKAGLDLNGNPGGDFFIVPTAATGAAGFAVAITDPAAIAAADSDGGVGNNRNALLLAALQTANTMNGGTATYQGAYSQLVNQVGNKTRELEMTSSAADKLLSESTLSLQNESGVNLDEEAANLLRYQQAYQAAGKVMQIASQMFDVLLSLGQ